jgi:cephalosporin hydroxylase
MNPIEEFQNECRKNIVLQSQDEEWLSLSNQWIQKAAEKKYMYNFSFLGRPIIQLPTDIQAFQEVVWSVQPDLIIETGIAHGGSLILSAGMLALLDYCDAVRTGEMLDPRQPKRKVLGVDIDIRAHNRAAIEEHPLSGRIQMLQGSSLDPDIAGRVREVAAGCRKVLLCLDSNHTHDHVLEELRLYARLVSKGSYCIVFDTIVEDLPAEVYPDRPWAPGNSPKSAVHAYLKELAATPQTDAQGDPLHFEIDREIDGKLLLSVAPDGFLRRV